MGDPGTEWVAAIEAQLDPELLTPIARRALGRPGATVLAFDANPIGYANINPDRRLLLRVAGTARDGDELLGWSVVLKAFRRPEDAASSLTDPTHFEFWEREPLFFESAWWAEVGPGLRAVTCHAVIRRPGNEVWIWLDDVADAHDKAWPAEAFEIAAAHLGRFAGSYVKDRPMPTDPWLADPRSIQLQYSIARPEMRAAILPLLESPPTTRAGSAAFGRDRDRAILRDAFHAQDRLLDAIDGVVPTLCHNDAFGSNLFARRPADGEPETIAIDWALVGIGPVGVEIAQLVAGSGLFFRAPTDSLDVLDSLDRRTFDAYLAGLAEVGANVDARDARLACLVSVLTRWTAVTAMHLIWALDPAEEEWVTGFWHRPQREVSEQFTPLLAFLTRRADEMLLLADARGLRSAR